MLGLTQPAHPARGSLNQAIQLGKFTRPPFTSAPQAHKVALVLQAILAAHSPRIRAIPHTPPGHPQAHHQASPRLLAQMNPQEALVKAGKAIGSWLLTWAALPPLSMLRWANACS